MECVKSTLDLLYHTRVPNRETRVPRRIFTVVEFDFSYVLGTVFNWNYQLILHLLIYIYSSFWGFGRPSAPLTVDIRLDGVEFPVLRSVTNTDPILHRG